MIRATLKKVFHFEAYRKVFLSFYYIPTFKKEIMDIGLALSGV